MHKQFIREHIETLNLAKNKLTDISCLNAMKDTRTFEFRKLQILNASRNMLTHVKLVNASLTEINLSHNELTKLPDFSSLSQLSKLLLSHNNIDDKLEQFGDLQKLRVLDLSSNKFSWRPTFFRKQMSHLERIHLEEFKLWPNPFAEGFKEYQFITAVTLSSLTSLDGFGIDSDLRFQLRVQADQLHMNTADFSVFDVRVEERRKRNTPEEVMAGTDQEFIGGPVPSVQELIDLMRLALDEPDNVLKHIYALEQKVSCVWHAHFWDRRRLMVVIQEGGRASTLNATMERLAVAEFADKMQQVLGRFESVQDVLVMCLVRMLSCGNRALAEKCGTLLAQWVDATAEEMHDRIDSMSEALFRDLRLHLVLGIQSINERPMGLYEISAGTKKGQEEVDEIELEQIEETWHILTALSKFGPSTLYDRMISPWRARVLRPFLPVLCREPRDVLGPDLPFDRWAEYTGFDAFPGEAAEVIEVEMNLLSFQEKCSRQGFGGFVLEAASEDGMVKVYFKQQKAQSLASLRRRCATRTLHVRPVGRVKRTEAAELGDGNNYSWNAWVNSLAVLVSATADPHNAALCVSMDAHLAVVRHESDNQGFTEATLLGSSEAKNAFLRLLRLGRNLMSASGDAGVKAAKYFLEQGLHTRCWSRARRRLQEGGSPLPLARLSELPANDVALIGELVGVLITMMKCDVKEICDKAMADIKAENGLDVFDVLLQVAASTTNPDPFFLAIAYETIYVFLKNDLMRAQLLSKVISQLRETAILLPYIRGPYVKDAPNEKYMQLWCKCELKYGTPNAARDRLRQLHDSQDPDESSQWREMVPEIRDLQNPMMHRTLLGIVKIIQLLSELAQGEDSEALKPVTDLLDASGRERLLIGPTTGLVTCPDFDVRVESLKCVRNVLEATPEQFDLEEMGWLLNYLTSVGMGIGKQGLFLMEVIELIKMFVRNKSNTGQSFRNKFAKYAIRESFEMLTVNSRRETHNKEETTAKTALTQKIIELLMDCSRPLSGGLRKFLRRVDLMETIRKVLQAEEQSSSQVAALGVLQTWTGRDIRQVLLPIITSPSFHVHGDVVHTALIRLADVLQGKPDYKMNDIFQELPPSDESRPWLGVDNLHRHVSDGCDAVEMEDSQDQHEYFVNSRGLEPLLDFVGRFFSASEELNLTLIKCQEDVANELDEKEKNLRSAWEDHERRIGGKATGEQKNDEDQTLDQVVQECIAARLRALNEGAVTHFRQNLNHYDEKKGEFSLTKLAKVYQSYWKDNETRMQVEVQERPDAIYQLLRVPDKICVDQQLKDLQEMEKIGKKHQHVRQPHRDFDRLHLQAKDAHTILKTMLCDSASREHPEVSRWCNQELTPETPPSVLQTGLADFLQDNQAQAIDAGVMSTSLLSDLDKYKYFGRHDRRTNMSLVYLEFPNARGLWEALEELLKRAQRLFLWQVRNHFRIPTALGEYYIALKFQLQLKDSYSSLHYAELRLCLSGKSKKLNTIQMFRETMKKAEQILHESCAVPLMETALVAQFLTSMLRSRSIRHNDVFFLRSQDVNLEVDDQNVFAQSAELMSCQLFIIEREAGAGVVKAGDRIRLKSQFTHKYLDVHASSHLRCRLLQPDPDYDMTFTVEIVGCRDDYALSRVGMTSKLKEFRGVHVESTLKLKVNGLNCVTVRHGGANFLTSFGERLAVKSEPMDAKLAAGQVFTIYRDGAQVLDFHAPHQSGRKPVRTLAGQTSDEILQKTMMEAHMRTEISSTTDADEGSFRRVPPAFRTMMWSIAGHFRGEAEQKSAGPEASLRKLWQRGSKNMAAMLRCAYMLLEVPKAPGGRRYILEAFSTRLTRHSVLSRIISMVSALQVIGQRLNDAPDLDIACALLPKKFLRICDAAITNLPLCQSPEDVEGKEEKREQREQERHERELATLDRERLWTMSLVSSYACRCVVRPMLNRLQVADQRQLDPNELLVFADFANLMAAMVQSIFDNEMRCVTQDHKKKATLNGLDALPALQNGTGNGAAASAGGAEGAATEGAEDTGATQSDAMVVAADTAGALQPVEAKKKAAPNALSEDARATVVEEVIPPITIKALVHLFLYAIHQEAIAFRNGASSEVPVRLISAMINACIAALAAVMNLTGSSNALDLPFDSVEAGGKVSCDYDICEAVSQAMTEGAQLVPRARVAQLQVERGIDALRPEVQEMLQDGEFDFSYGVQKKLYSTERVNTISYVWTRNNKHLEERRSILVTTTRFRLFFLGFSEDGAMPRRSDLFLLSSVRDMRNIRRAVFSSRIRQFLCLLWEEEVDMEFLVFESTSRRRYFQEALRRVPRERKKIAGEEAVIRRNAKGITGAVKGVWEVSVNPATIATMLDTCQVRRGGIPLVSVSFVHTSGLVMASRRLSLLVLTRCSLTVIPFHSFWSKFWRPNDDRYYDADENVDQAAMDTDSDDDQLPPFKETVVSTSNDTEEKFEASKGPFDFDDLQGVWFLAESSPKVRLQFSTTLDLVFTSDGERQRFRRHLANILSEEAAPKAGKTRQQWAVVPTDQTDLKP